MPETTDGWLTGYKCVTPYDGIPHSWSWGGEDVEYPLPRRRCAAERPAGCGPLAVFTSEVAAREFYYDWGGGKHGLNCIYKCLYKPSADDCLWTERGCSWNAVPPGTAYADAVRLTRRVL